MLSVPMAGGTYSTTAPPLPPGHPRELGIGLFGVFQHFFQCRESPRRRTWLCFHGSIRGSGGWSPFPSHPIPGTGSRHGQGKGKSHPRRDPCCWPHGQPPPRPTVALGTPARAGLGRGGGGKQQGGKKPKGKLPPAPLRSAPQGPGNTGGQDRAQRGGPEMAVMSWGQPQCPRGGCSVPEVTVLSQGQSSWPRGDHGADSSVARVATVSQRWQQCPRDGCSVLEVTMVSQGWLRCPRDCCSVLGVAMVSQGWQQCPRDCCSVLG